MRNLIIIALITLIIGVTLNSRALDTQLQQNTLQQQNNVNSKLAEFENLNTTTDNNTLYKKVDTDTFVNPDFGPYMRELQRSIKLNWEPPKGSEDKTVVLLFKIAKDGRLLSSKIHKSSGLQSADQAALKAVELTTPFNPLPQDFNGENIDIHFTFDNKVLSSSRY